MPRHSGSPGLLNVEANYDGTLARAKPGTRAGGRPVCGTLVGEGYIDAQCGRFLTALDELERSKRGTLANLNALQSATVGIMGLALAAQKAIGVVGVAFGLAASLIDNSTSIVLYQLPASSIRTIVKAQRDSLRLAEGPPNLRSEGGQRPADIGLAKGRAGKRQYGR